MAKPSTMTTEKGQPGREDLWQAALYLRLSREDGDKEESDSVANQRALLSAFAQQEPDILVREIYVDDGWSGATFDRPAFQRMLADIKSRAVNCVIVKDLSRFGRNYIDTGDYLEKVFPRLGVRFIAVTDHLDSVKNPQEMNTLVLPVKNLINDEYCRDISKKVGSSLTMKRRQGKHIGSFACYGYQKDPDDHNHLVPDPDAADTVREIYRLFLGGSSILGIARLLNARGVPNPTVYKQRAGLRYRHAAGQTQGGLWPDSSVRRILKNRMYLGDMVQGVHKTVSYKVPLSRQQPQADWIVVEGTHEAIVSRQDFEAVQAVLEKRTRTAPAKGEVYLFSGFLHCADCGAAMNRKLIRQPYGDYCYYICSTFKKLPQGGCTKHTIRSDRLEAAVLETIRRQVALAVDMDEAIRAINESPRANRAAGSLRRQLEQAQRDLEAAETLLVDLYPDWKAGHISQEVYLRLRDRTERQNQEAALRIADLEKRIAEAGQGQDGSNEFLRRFLRCRGIETLTREVIVALIADIAVFEGGDIRIRFNCRDPFEAAVEYIESNRSLLPPACSPAVQTA